jgi:transposase
MKMGRSALILVGPAAPGRRPISVWCPQPENEASWVGLCPGNDQSGGRRRSGKTTKGNPWLRTALVQVAWAAAHPKGTRSQALYQRWAKRLGKKKALVAVGIRSW